MRLAALVLASSLAIWLLPLRGHAGDEPGDPAFHRGDLEAAREAWWPLAEQGDPRAQFGLGRLLLLDGDTKGVAWVRRSAEAGHLPAELRLAHFTYGGLYVPVDLVAGESWLRKAAGHDVEDMRAHPIEGGTARAILAQLEAGAQGNYEQALPYLRKVADAGDAEAQLDYVINLERLIDKRSQDPAARRKDPGIPVAHAYAVICERQDAGVGAFIFTPDRIAKRLHDEMSEAQRARSKELVRAWFEAKAAGTLGWLYDQHKRKLSLGEQALAMLAEMEEAMGYLRLELLEGPCSDPPSCWLQMRTPVERWSPGRKEWAERWVVHACGETFTKRVTFTLRDDHLSWEFQAWLSLDDEVQDARNEARALQERGEFEKARAMWIRLATEGDAVSEIELGRVYEHGLGVERSAAEAHKWYVLAGRLGATDAPRLALALHERMTEAEREDARQRIQAWMDPPVQGQPEAMFPIQEDGKVGYMDRTGRVVVAPQFEGWVHAAGLAGGGSSMGDYKPVRSALVPVLRDGWWGFLDDRGNVVVSPRFEQVGEFREGRLPVLKAKRWGYLNRSGRLVIGLQFDEAGRFRGGFARVCVGDQVGMIDTQGVYVVPLGEFDDVRGANEEIAVVRRGDKAGYFDLGAGTLLAEPRFPVASDFEGGVAAVGIDGRRAFIDRRGHVTEVPELRKFEFARHLTGSLFAFRRDGRFGLFDVRRKRIVVQTRYDFVGRVDQGLISVVSGGMHGYIDRSGKEVIPPRFSELGAFADGLAAAQADANREGYIDTSGAWVIQPIFARAGSFQHGLAVAQREFTGPYVYIDRTGKTVYTFPPGQE